MNINLIGMRGVGKSNVARRLSVLTKRPVMSTDVLIEYESGLPVPEFVAERAGRSSAIRVRDSGEVGRDGRSDRRLRWGAVVDLDAAGDGSSAPARCRRCATAARSCSSTVTSHGWRPRPRLTRRVRCSTPGARLSRSCGRAEPFYEQAADWTIFVERDTRQAAAEVIAAKYPE